MEIEAGIICLVEFPFTDQAASKLRPALVAGVDNPLFLAVTDGVCSPAGMNVSFLQITSREDPGVYNVIVDPSLPGNDITGLRKISTIRCWNINTIHRGFIKMAIGRLPEPIMKEVKDKLRERLGL